VPGDLSVQLAVFKRSQRRIDELVRNEQLYATCSAFQVNACSDYHRGYSGSLQCEPGHIGIESCRVGLYGLHDCLRQVNCVATSLLWTILHLAISE
jgi:hypothetical protein